MTPSKLILPLPSGDASKHQLYRLEEDLLIPRITLQAGSTEGFVPTGKMVHTLAAAEIWVVLPADTPPPAPTWRMVSGQALTECVATQQDSQLFSCKPHQPLHQAERDPAHDCLDPASEWAPPTGHRRRSRRQLQPDDLQGGRLGNAG